MNNETHSVGQYTKDGQRVATMSGMGRHKGKWESLHSQRTAQRHAAQCRKDDPSHVYLAEGNYDEPRTSQARKMGALL